MKSPRTWLVVQTILFVGLGLVVLQAFGLWSPPRLPSLFLGIGTSLFFSLMVALVALIPVEGGEPQASVRIVAPHLAAGIAGFGCCLWSQKIGQTGSGLLVALSLSPLVGLLLTFRLRRDLRLIQEALSRFVRGAPLPDLPARPHPILRPTYEALGALTVQGSDLQEIRDNWLRKVGEAAAQEERNRLARDLHDSIKQQLFGIHLSTATVRQRWETDPQSALAALDQAQRSAKEALVEMQAMLRQLQPQAVAAAGLAEALREQAEALGYRSGAQIVFEASEPIPDDRLPPAASEALFRIGQEALANIARHARAKHVRLELRRQGESVVLAIEDDGQGFDPGEIKEGMGLRNLRERVAALQGILVIDSRPGAGTTIRVAVPLLPPPAPPEVLQRLERKLRKAERDGREWIIWPILQLARLDDPGFILTARATFVFWLVWSGLAFYAWAVSRAHLGWLRDLPASSSPLQRARLLRAGHAHRALFWCSSLYTVTAISPATPQWVAAVLFCLIAGVGAGWELIRFCRWSAPGKLDFRVVGLAALGIAVAVVLPVGPPHTFRPTISHLILGAGAFALVALFAVRSAARTPRAAEGPD